MPRPIMPDTLEHLRDIPFARTPQLQLKLDIVRPRVLPPEPLPAILWIHGGGWHEGLREHMLIRCVQCALDGYVCATLTYRFSQHAIFPAQIQDCKCAIRHLRAHATHYHIDPERIGAGGESAGGHLASLLGTTRGVAEFEGDGGWPGVPSHVSAVCNIFGPTDLIRITETPSRVAHNTVDDFRSRLIGGFIKDNLEKARRASPATFVSPSSPPFLIIHGTKDELGPFSQAELLRDKLTAAGVENELVGLENSGHGGGEYYTDDIRVLITRFFDKHLKPVKAL